MSERLAITLPGSADSDIDPSTWVFKREHLPVAEALLRIHGAGVLDITLEASDIEPAQTHTED